MTSITIPASVTTIEGLTFDGCTGLTSIEFLNSVIGPQMFSGCESLTSVTIPNSVTSIGNYAFSNCHGLRSVSIGNNVASIGQGAFAHCSGLTFISIPSSVKSIGSYVFKYCDALKSITSYITDVFETDLYAFFGCTNATLYVPKGLVDTYKSTADWSSFNKIKEITDSYDVNIDGSIDISDVVSLVNFILSSSKTDGSYDVNGDSNVDISDVVSLVNFILGQ